MQHDGLQLMGCNTMGWSSLSEYIILSDKYVMSGWAKRFKYTSEDYDITHEGFHLSFPIMRYFFLKKKGMKSPKGFIHSSIFWPSPDLGIRIRDPISTITARITITGMIFIRLDVIDPSGEVVVSEILRGAIYPSAGI